MSRWLLLIYKVPSEPSARRVYVWRKLKRLGALLLHDSAWVLPALPRTREHLQWLAAEIREMNGEALLWDADPLLADQEKSLVEQFVAQIETEYREILTALAQTNPDLAALSQRYQQINAIDYFDCPLGAQVRSSLLGTKSEEEDEL